MYASARHSLVIVSNRLPFTVEPRPEGPLFTRSPGGLVTALEPVLSDRGGVWIGWNGLNTDDAGDLAGFAPESQSGVRYRALPLSAREVARYYEGFSNRTLWPLFHYFVSSTRIDARTWRTYEQVNQRFAEAAVQESDPDSMIWIHDYQLLRVPHYLRQHHERARIGFFLHVPFPSADVFRVLPWSRAIMRGMLGADLVGFHVQSYAEHFLLCAERLLGCEVDSKAGIVQFEGRQVSVQAHPIGVDVAHIEALASAAPPRPDVTEPGDGVAQVLGVDRLDYSKGLHQRLLSIERLFELHPMHRGRVTFTQILVPSRERVKEYEQLKRDIDETIGRVNGKFSEGGWTPIRYMVRSFPQDELMCRYHQAHVALVTPLRDGMNLVAKEYVAAQVSNDGVLILSELAGAAEELQEALLVNPFDVEAVTEALHSALTMPRDERRARMSALRDRVRANDVHGWIRRFLQAAGLAWDRARNTDLSPSDRVRRALEGWLGTRSTVAVFVDYDGTLTPIVDRPEEAVLSDAVRELLEQAARVPYLDLVVVSGRALDDVRSRVPIPGITVVGNHGFEIEGPGISYRHPHVDAHRANIERAAGDLARIDAPGTQVEQKGATVAFHVRRVDSARKGEAVTQALSVLRDRGLEVMVGNQVVEGRPPLDWHKGRAVLHVLRERHGANWPSKVRVIYIGDDTTDQDAFRSLRGIGRSIQVGRARNGTATADFMLPDPAAVLQFLRWLVSGGFVSPG
ncbi:MAG: bifunctional alpha,alpha-trehalose-phosphate synthase (UDP-forming)/trehalose-phosphatase [Gemmatimonadetes bacterium]|nr:bifunctional alpha,alpha-trehalose-phosphate synthase (UDP-forming)/trehalose-phosphatase [Gemmatimonadota bacterium]